MDARNPARGRRSGEKKKKKRGFFDARTPSGNRVRGG